VAIVVRIFEPGNNGLGRTNLPRKLGLRELGLYAKFVNLPGNVQIGLFLFDQVGHFLALAGKCFHERQCITGALLSLWATHFQCLRWKSFSHSHTGAVPSAS
jgi:hypothetical protein